MKKNFITGLILLLPVTLTVWVLIFAVDLLTNPFIDITESIISQFFQFSSPFFAQHHIFFTRCLILIFLSITLFITGLLAQTFLLKHIFRLSEYLISRTPFINRIYKTFQDIIHTFAHHKRERIARVALVPFPYKNAYCIGMVTADKMPEDSDLSFRNKVSLFVPGTPNPTMGFMLLYDKSDIVLLDMSVEEAFKFLVSCGSITANFKISENQDF